MIKITQWVSGYHLSAVILITYFLLIFPLAKSFPYTDDFTYLTWLTSGNWPPLAELFAAHNDHRIPIQKLVSLALLKINGGNFSSLIGLNAVLCGICSVVWVRMLRLVHNGKLSVAELAIPLFVMGWGFNTVSWGFNFQFILGFLLVSVALHHVVSSTLGGGDSWGPSYIALSFAALSGGNGLIASTVTGCAVALAGWRIRPAMLREVGTLVPMAIWLLVCVLLGASFSPSSATRAEAVGIGVYSDFFWGIWNSWLGISSTINLKWSKPFATAAFLLVLAFEGVHLCKAIRASAFDHRAVAGYVALTALLDSFVVILAVTLSRAASQPWWSGLELHYGFLALGLPMSMALIVSIIPNRRVKWLLSTGLVALALVAFVMNAKWRYEVAVVENKRNVLAAKDILDSSISDLNVARSHISEFYWHSDEDSVRSVAAGIARLRYLRVWSDIQNANGN